MAERRRIAIPSDLFDGKDVEKQFSKFKDPTTVDLSGKFKLLFYDSFSELAYISRAIIRRTEGQR